MANATAGPRTDIDLDHFRELIEEERSRVLEQLRQVDAREEAGDSGVAGSELSDYDQHPADEATETFLREQDQAIHVGLYNELRQVEAAASKLERGTYGVCDRCGAEIPAERLEVMPFALYCVRCAADLEGQT
jgi:RNA polymerase-binding transcription factor DksA